MWLIPSGFSASTMALITAPLEAIVPASPMPLTPSSLVGLGRHGPAEHWRGNFVRRGDQVVGERARHELARVGIVGHFFEQRLGDALGDPALQLAIDDHRVDDDAAVVDGDVLQQVNAARLGIDLHQTDVGAERPHEVRWVEVGDRLEAVVDARGQAAAEGGKRHLAHRLAAARVAFGVEAALVEDDVVGRYLEHVRGDLRRFGDDLIGRRPHGHAAHRQTAAPIRTVAERWALGGVAVAHFDRVVRQPKGVRRDLGKGRIVALAVGMRADEHLGRPRRVNADMG